MNNPENPRGLPVVRCDHVLVEPPGNKPYADMVIRPHGQWVLATDYEKLLAERDAFELPDRYRVEQHVSGNWYYVVGDHASANYWPTRSQATSKAWAHRERQLLRDLNAAIRRNGRAALAAEGRE
ncbi:MAG TPA: hypothetical protein VFH85_07930 [Gammaproteobacteria bacterium]|nr:hypothetical protein [Gammaproteobacteria bacterium]